MERDPISDRSKGKHKLAADVLLGKYLLNNIVRTLIDRSGDEEKAKIEILLAGGSIEVQIHEDITYNEIYDERDNLWNFMFFTGYFRKISEWMVGETIYAKLVIPNKEVQYIFSQKVQKWFRDSLKGRDMQLLYKAVISKECVVHCKPCEITEQKR